MVIDAVLLRDRETRDTIHVLQRLIRDYPGRDFALRLWDGTRWRNREQPRFTLVLNHPGALRAMFSPSIELMLAEAFIHGDFDIEGDIEAAFELADFLLAREMPIRDKLRLGGMLMKLPTRARSLTQPDRYGERKS